MKHSDRFRITAANIAYALEHYPTFYAAIRDRTADGYPSGGDHGPRAGISDPTPGAVAARTRTAGHWQELDATAIELQALSARVVALIALYATPTRDDRHDLPQRCSGGQGLDGAEVWGDPGCDRYKAESGDDEKGNPGLTKDGLCSACRRRRDRWRRDHGIPSQRRRGA